MGGSARTPTLTALLCLGELSGKEEGWGRPLPAPMSWSLGDLRTGEDQAGAVPLPLGPSSRQKGMDCGFRGGLLFTAHSIWGMWGPWGDGSCNQLPPSPLGQYDAPSLSATPGPVVALGGNVSLSCSSSWPWELFHLLKEQGADAPQHLEWMFHRKRGQGLFHMGPVNTSHAGTYRCYVSPESYPDLWSQSSDPLHLQVTGVYRAPSLLAQPGSLVQSGDSLTLQCRSEIGFDRFALTKDEELRAPQHLEGQSSPNFPLGPVSHTHGGRYQCYSGHKLSSTWSAPSAPLGVLITGMYEKPSLSIQSGTSVSWGENVTLQCRSEIWFDTFHLSKEGSLAPPQVLRVQDTARPYQVNFILSPVTSDLEGTYRCYSSHSNYPYLLSQPSDPLELLVSSEGPQSCPLCVLMECQGGMGVRGSQVTLSGMTCLWGDHRRTLHPAAGVSLLEVYCALCCRDSTPLGLFSFPAAGTLGASGQVAS
uniref:Ig-like domain-containing protein n=1 Tax=Neovison vison TaxID=452646 RepID=A0A8C7AIM1_NEOVI